MGIWKKETKKFSKILFSGGVVMKAMAEMKREHWTKMKLE